jgi:heterotetrameric sarcosine oxidase gamma subunit
VHSARFVDSQGWQVPAVYSSIERELEAARAGAGVADISAFAKLSVVGPELGHELAANPREVVTIDAGYSMLACRLRADQLLVLASTPDPTGISERLATVFQPRALTDATSANAEFCLVGPAMLELLRRLTPLDVTDRVFPIGSCAETSLAGVHVLLVKPPTSPLPVVQICVARDLGEYLWERLFEAGKNMSLAPMGLQALASLNGHAIESSP